MVLVLISRLIVLCQTITWTNKGLLPIELLQTNFSKIWIKAQKFDYMWNIVSEKSVMFLIPLCFKL